MHSVVSHLNDWVSMRVFPSILPFLPGEEGTIGRSHEVPLRGGGFRGRDSVLSNDLNIDV